jgi:hypothetical protein
MGDFGQIRMRRITVSLILLFATIDSLCSSLGILPNNMIGPKSENSKRISQSLDQSTKTRPGDDNDYPYQFTGRLLFSPSLVPTNTATEILGKNHPTVTILSFLGYTLGGSVALEYDTSPVGPYKEYVTMSSLVAKNGMIGQWGSRLFVSTQEAEDVCRDIWGVPAELAQIDFHEENMHGNSDSRLETTACCAPANSTQRAMPQRIVVQSWKDTRVLKQPKDTTKRWGNVPVYWTPTIKALWLRYTPFPNSDAHQEDIVPKQQNSMEADERGGMLPLHKLRISASAIRLRWSGWNGESEEGSVPLGVGLVVDNVLIEIGNRCGNLE